MDFWNWAGLHRNSELLPWSASKLRPTSHITTPNDLHFTPLHSLQPYICQGLVSLGQIHLNLTFHLFPLCHLTFKSTISQQTEAQEEKTPSWGFFPQILSTSTWFMLRLKSLGEWCSGFLNSNLKPILTVSVRCSLSISSQCWLGFAS